MNYFIIIYAVILFFVLVPGQFLTLPSQTSEKYIISITHGVIFAIIYHFTHKIVWNATSSKDEKDRITY